MKLSLVLVSLRFWLKFEVMFWFHRALTQSWNVSFAVTEFEVVLEGKFWFHSVPG